MKPKDKAKAAAVAKGVEARLVSRMDHLGIKPLSKRGADEECAFLAGAASAMHAMFGGEDGNLSAAVPPAWIIWPMSGRSAYMEIKRKEKEAA
jgi:hypothetical protein